MPSLRFCDSLAPASSSPQPSFTFVPSIQVWSATVLTPIQLFTHAVLMFQNECLGELEYESTAAAILMAGIFLSFLVEYLGIRLVQWHAAKSSGHTDGGHSHNSPST